MTNNIDNRFEEFTCLILKAGKLIQRIKNIEMKEYNLRAVHVMCLYYLNQRREGLTNAELVKLTFEDKAAVSRAISSLVKNEYVKYDKNSNSLIRITELGKQVASCIIKKANNAVLGVGNTLNEDERENFYRVLKIITENLSKYHDSLDN